MKTKLMDKVN